MQYSGKVRFVRLAEMVFITCDRSCIYDEEIELTSMAYLSYVKQWSAYKFFYLPEKHNAVNKVMICTLKTQQSR